MDGRLCCVQDASVTAHSTITMCCTALEAILLSPDGAALAPREDTLVAALLSVVARNDDTALPALKVRPLSLSREIFAPDGERLCVPVRMCMCDGC